MLKRLIVLALNESLESPLTSAPFIVIVPEVMLALAVNVPGVLGNWPDIVTLLSKMPSPDVSVIILAAMLPPLMVTLVLPESVAVPVAVTVSLFSDKSLLADVRLILLFPVSVALSTVKSACAFMVRSPLLAVTDELLLTVIAPLEDSISTLPAVMPELPMLTLFFPFKLARLPTVSVAPFKVNPLLFAYK